MYQSPKWLPGAVVALTILSILLLHWDVFPKELMGSHTWRQSQTRLNILNFYQHDPNILNPRVAQFNTGTNLYRYEFPLMQWIIGMIHRMLGSEHILITRAMLFLIGSGSLLGFYAFAKQVLARPLHAALATLALAYSPVYSYWMVNPIPDNLALGLTCWFLYFFIRNLTEGIPRWPVAGPVFIGLATLVKLPFVLFGVLPFIHWLSMLWGRKGKFKSSTIRYGAAYSLCILPAIAWYAWVIPGWTGNGVVAGIFDNGISWKEVGNILEYHAETMLPHILMTPITLAIFGVSLIGFFVNGCHRQLVGKYVLLGFTGVLLYFLYELNMINIVHDYYMFPFLPFLFLGVGYGIQILSKWHPIMMFLVIGALLIVPAQTNQKHLDSWEPDPGNSLNLWTYQDDLIKAVPDTAKVVILNDHSRMVFAYMVRKQGLIFGDDHLPTRWVEDIIRRQRIFYMYSDSRKVDQDSTIQTFIDTTLLEAGDIKVFKFKELQ